MRRTAPQLMFDQQHDCWRLNLEREGGNDDGSYFMLINYAWNGETWSSYRFMVVRMGDESEVVTKAEYDQRVKDIEEYEGEEIAKLWHLEQTHVEVERDNHPVFALREQWDAMMALEIFVPHVTIGGFKNMPGPSKELREKTDVLRAKAWEEEMKAMDEAYETRATSS